MAVFKGSKSFFYNIKNEVTVYVKVAMGNVVAYTNIIL